MGEKGHTYRISVRKPEGKRPLGRPRSTESNIKTDIRGTGCVGMDWINFIQDRDYWRALVNTVTNFRVP
jgi:hypothetical protein